MLPKLFFISILSSFIFNTHSYTAHLCLDHQKSLLLQLKNELRFNSSLSTKLARWNQTHDCCEWHGVDCDDAGNVINLQLDGESISGGIGDSSSLFRLQHLEKLNLAYNDFNDSTPIPKGIHKLNNLTHLNLSNAGFGGQVPIEILSLNRLVSLDISTKPLLVKPLKLENPNLKMLIQNLTRIRELYLVRVNITSAYERRKWSHIISSYLPNLTTLSLADCSLSGPLAKSFSQLHSLSTLQLDWNDLSTPVPDLFSNLSSLTTLSLRHCGLKGSFPNKIFHMPTLQYLDLSRNNQLSGSLPPFTQNGSLKSIRLRETYFSGSIPSSISNLKNLSELDLSSCKFSGNIPNSLFALPSLLVLQLGGNHFTLQVEALSVKINLSNIVDLDLSSNQLEGPIPDFFFQLRSLKSLSLSNNLFSGTFQLEKIKRLANLTVLSLSGNNLRIEFANDNLSSYGFPQLKELFLASCNLNDFPDFIKHFGMIESLDLSNNGIGGEIPNWIWGNKLGALLLTNNLVTGLQEPYHIPSSLYYLDLSSNQLSGKLHHLITSRLEYLLLSNNSFTGSIPTSLCATQLQVLDLSINKLSGTIPSCLLQISVSLRAVDLAQNNINGSIPDITSPYCYLEYIDVSDNTLEGKIPRSLKNCEELTYMNVGNNIINDTFPCMLPSSLRFLVLHANNFHGDVRCDSTSWPHLQILDISSNHFSGSLETINFSSWRAMVQGTDSYSTSNYLGYYTTVVFVKISRLTLIMKGQQVELQKIFQDFTAIDLSCNHFIGEIPNAIGDLTSLRLLNFSLNALNGCIPNSFGQLRKLESLDLSQNQLIGAIPMELAGLTFLSSLNLSYNMLVGEIPNGRQLHTFSADSFRGNAGLCGFNLNKSCSIDYASSQHENEEGEKKEIEWEYVSAALGYVVGLGSIVWLLLFCRSFREKYFDKIEDVVQEISDARDMRRRRHATAMRRQ